MGGLLFCSFFRFTVWSDWESVVIIPRRVFKAILWLQNVYQTKLVSCAHIYVFRRWLGTSTLPGHWEIPVDYRFPNCCATSSVLIGKRIKINQLVFLLGFYAGQGETKEFKPGGTSYLLQSHLPPWVTSKQSLKERQSLEKMTTDWRIVFLASVSPA